MQHNFARTFETSRLLIRAIENGDAPAIFSSYGSDPEVARYMTWPCTGDIRDTEAFVHGAVSVWNGGDSPPLRFDYLVLLKESREIAGAIGFAPQQGFKASIGYNFARKMWGKGIATEALSCVTEYLLSRPDIYRVWAVHDIENPASGRVLQKCGYLREGALKRESIHPNVSREPRDAVLWARTR